MSIAYDFFEKAAGIGADGHPLNADGKRSGQTDTHWSSPRREASEGDLAEWEEKLAREIEERAFDITTTPIRPTPSFYINRVGISTAGNLTVISAASKAGKSAFISAMQASAMVVEDVCRDFLGVSSDNLRSHAMLHFDTEQSRYDHHECVLRTLKRAGIAEPPPWFGSYCLTGKTAVELRAALVLKLKLARAAHRGIHSVCIDGIGDYVQDVNDATEANELVAQLQTLAMEYDCPIICIIHVNPNGTKTRGHLGSQLERKAETNLRLEKTDDVTVVWSDRNRRAPIPKATGPRFMWSNECGMHVSTEAKAASKATAKATELRRVAEAVFAEAGSNTLAWKTFVGLLSKLEVLTKAGATKRLNAMKKAGVVAKNQAGQWTLTGNS